MQLLKILQGRARDTAWPPTFLVLETGIMVISWLTSMVAYFVRFFFAIFFFMKEVLTRRYFFS